MPNEKDKIISDYLRAADRAIKENKLDDALESIKKVFEIDSRSVYARAYQERIVALKETQKEKELQEKLQKEQAKQEEPPKSEEKVETPTIEPEKVATTLEAKEHYKKLLLDLWTNGALGEREKNKIAEERKQISITDEDLHAIEKEVQLTAYINEIKNTWMSGSFDFESARKKFQITAEDHLKVEPQIYQLISSLQSRGTSKGHILLLDDDEVFLGLMKQVLEDDGYTCYTGLSGEEGLKLLEKHTPDAVICDVNFPKSQMSGFTFLEKFRSMDKFLLIPFIFLSGMNVEVILRTIKQSGADDYLTKPIDQELLIAALEGRIKRAKEIKKLVSSKA